MDFPNTSGIRSPFSPRVRQSLASRRSIGLTSLKKSQSKYGVSSLAGQTGEVVTRTASNTVEGFGLPLPVLVTEVLTFADPNTHVSAKLLPSGWCWVVCGRKLLVWQYRDIAGSSLSHGATGASCKELTLPQTDLAHKADLVCVFASDESQVPSCIGVSPEGLVRYWPSIAHEGSYVDESADLQGQECDTLTDVTPVGCVLATTTCTIVLVQPNVIGGRHSVVARTLRAPSGWLGGLGRRVSLLFFGSMPSAQMAETKLVGVAVIEQLVLPLDEGGDAGGPYITCMAAGPCLQLWRLPAAHSGAPERLLHELELRKPLREAFVEAQLFSQGDIGSIDVYVLDMQASGSGLLLLLGAVVLPGTQMRYALAQISVEENPSCRVTSFVSLQYCAEYTGDGTQALALRMLVSSSTTYLYTQTQLTVMSSTISNDKPDTIDFNSNGDKLLGGALCVGKPLFFTKNHGVVAVTSNDFSTNDISICDSPIGSPCPADGYDGHLSIYEMDPHEMSTISYDISGKLRTAFLFHIRRDAVASRALIQQIFPPPPSPPAPSSRSAVREIPSIESEDDEPQIDVDAKLDRTVMKIGEELLDDVPAGDPRWNQPMSGTTSSIPLGSSGALQIVAHLRDKLRALSLFIDFLRASGLWSRLGAVSKDGGGAVSTVAVLGSMLERLAAASALRRMQQASHAHAHIIDTAIQIVVNEEDSDDTNMNNASLSPSDLFYKKVTGVDRALHAIVCWCGEQATSDTAAQSLTTLLLNANQVLLGVIQDILKCRQQRWELVTAAREADASAVTWSSDSGPQGLLSALMLQQEVTIYSGARMASEASLRGQLYDQALALSEYILGEAREQAEARGASHMYVSMYHNHRSQLIQPFIEDGQFDRAGILAEKFLDFEKLVLICQKANDIEKLYTYMDKYEKDGMVEYTFAWYVDNGLSSSLMCSFSRYGERLRAWLAATPERASLQWLHQLATDQWGDAARCLVNLAHNETQYTQRMKTMASLGKLCLLLASEDAESESLSETCERRLQLAEHVQRLPKSILLSHGLEDEARNGNIRVITPAEIVDMYVTSEDKTLTEFDYKKALEVTELADDTEREFLRRNIWIASILHDDWRHYDPSCPLDAVQEKIFFKLIEWSLVTGYDLESNLPTVEDILESPELAHTADDAGFQFILKYGYEHLYTQQTDNMITD